MFNSFAPTPGKHQKYNFDAPFFSTPMKSPNNIGVSTFRKNSESYFPVNPMPYNLVNEEPKPIDEPKQNEEVLFNASIMPSVIQISPIVEAENLSKKKPKKTTKKSKRRNLSSREDVMNKNVFRAIKRQLKTMYNNYISSSKFRNLDASNKSDTFLGKSNNFSEYLLSSSGIEVNELLFNKKDYMMYVAIMLDYCQMKKIVNTPQDKEKLDATFNVIYSYSHQKFYEYTSIKEVKLIFKIIFNNIDIESFINSHDTLKIT